MALIRPVNPGDRDEWLRMRILLWPECPRAEHLSEIASYFTNQLQGAAFVAEGLGGGLAGFIEVSLRSIAEGCSTHPVGYVEGWYVDAGARMTGIGRALLEAGERWAIGCGCEEMASDTELDNVTSQLAHEQLGYEEAERLVHFRKTIKSK